MRVLFLTIAIATLLACGPPPEPRGPEFCDSYERNYVGACRQHCEADIELGDAEAGKACEDKCAKDLKADDTYADSCVKK